jgi:hypothetical protein
VGTPALVNADIEGGESLLRALDTAGLGVRTAFWFYFPESSDWRLVLALPLVDQRSSRAAYEAVRRVLDRSHLDLPLRRITVVGLNNPFISTLRRSIVMPPGAISNVRMSNDRVGDFLVEDAYIYRST